MLTDHISPFFRYHQAGAVGFFPPSGNVLSFRHPLVPSLDSYFRLLRDYAAFLLFCLALRSFLRDLSFLPPSPFEIEDSRFSSLARALFSPPLTSSDSFDPPYHIPFTIWTFPFLTFQFRLVLFVLRREYPRASVDPPLNPITG